MKTEIEPNSKILINTITVQNKKCKKINKLTDWNTMQINMAIIMYGNHVMITMSKNKQT